MMISSLVLLSTAHGQDRPLAPVQPWQLSCSGGGGSVHVSCRADFATTDVVSFGVARADDSERFQHVHYVTDVQADGSASAIIPQLLPGVEYIVTARSHSRGASKGWNEKWSAMTADSATCQAAAEDMSKRSHRLRTAVPMHTSASATSWIEVYRYRGAGYGQEPTIKDYNLPDFVDNHNTGDVNKQMSRWDFPGSADPAKYNFVSYTRYCVEVLDVQLPTAVHNVGMGGPTTTKPFSNYLPCDGGKCHCANKFDAFTLEGEIQSQQSWVDQFCPKVGNCQCENEQIELSLNYTGRWGFSPPFTDDSYMSNGQPACGWPEHAFPCHGDASPKGYWYHHPEATQCKTNEQVGENGCTWKASPLMHTLSVQQLLDANSIGGQPTYRSLSIDQELQYAANGLNAFEQVGATPCGPTAYVV